jgi:hypothetical protein
MRRRSLLAGNHGHIPGRPRPAFTGYIRQAGRISPPALAGACGPLQGDFYRCGDLWRALCTLCVRRTASRGDRAPLAEVSPVGGAQDQRDQAPGLARVEQLV